LGVGRFETWTKATVPAILGGLLHFLGVTNIELAASSINKNKSIPSRILTYPTWGKGTSSSNIPWGGDMLVSRRVIYFIIQAIFQIQGHLMILMDVAFSHAFQQKKDNWTRILGT